MFGRQLDVFGDEHDIAPANERMRLFEPVGVNRGQMSAFRRTCAHCGSVFVSSVESTRCDDCSNGWTR